MRELGAGGLQHRVSYLSLRLYVWTDLCLIAFGTPVLLKRKADTIAAPGPPPPSQPVPKWPRRDRDRNNIERMRMLLQTGARRLDTLWGAQMAAQEASGVMAAVMLQQQGVMREVSVWELEVEGVMREMSRLVDGAEPDM